MMLEKLSPRDQHNTALQQPREHIMRHRLDSAYEASLVGDWSRVASLVDSVSPSATEERVTAALLTARAALGTDMPERALVAIDAVNDELNADQSVTFLMLRGSALAALGQDKLGTALLLDVVRATHGAARSEALFELAKAHVRAGRSDEARAVLTPIIDAPPSDRRGEFIIPHVLSLYGKIELRRHRRAIASRQFIDALDAIQRGPKPYAPLEASLIYDLARIAIDTLDHRLFVRVQRALKPISWPIALADTLGAIRRLLVTGEILFGDRAAAGIMTFEAIRDAPPGSAYVEALVSAATITRMVRDRFTSERLSMMAAAEARKVVWVAGDVPILLAAICETARSDVQNADQLLAIFDTLRSRGVTYDSQAWLYSLARAAIAGAKGNLADQAIDLRSALAAAQAIENLAAEVVTVLELIALEPDDSLLSRADKLTSEIPLSLFRRRYEWLAAHAHGALRLSPTERRVMEAICEGLSTSQIAARFRRSKDTIRNQTRRVFEVMEVHSRSALVSKCAFLDATAW